MPDARAMTRLLDELLWSLRRAGFVVSTAQAIDVARAATVVGVEDRAAFVDAIAAIVVRRAQDRARFDAAFDRFFAAAREPRGTLWERLARRGFTDAEIAEVRGLLDALASTSPEGAPLGALLERGADLDRLLSLADVTRGVASQNRLQVGFYTYRVLERVGLPAARVRLAALRAQLRDALGERGDGLGDALVEELDKASEDARAHVAQAIDRRAQQLDETGRGRTLDSATFTSLSEAEVDEVRRAVRRFADRLRGAERVRARHAKQGRIDPHRTLRRALRTGGVPLVPARKRRRRDRPKLVLICDVSDSVRNVACFLLEFAYAAQELFERTRTFVFVSALGETTALFAKEPVSVALGHAYGGGVVSVHDNSNYGRMLRTFEAEHLRSVDRRTTVVILGDGRTNYHDDAADVLDRIRSRARALIWLCPEARSEWSLGDSAMARYAPKCSEVLEVRCARDLEAAGRAVAVGR